MEYSKLKTTWIPYLFSQRGKKILGLFLIVLGVCGVKE